MTRPKVINFTYFTGKKYDNMMRRCYRESERSYPNYGGRGIRVCDEWITDIEVFRTWIRQELVKIKMTEQEFIESDLSLDRIDSNGHYEPNNCRLSNKQIQSRNQRQGSMKRKIMSSTGKIYFIGLLAAIIFVSCQGKTGPSGPPGPQGIPGPQGLPGTSCTATQVSGGVQVTCTDGTSALVLNGANGTPGAQGAPGTNGAAGVNGHSALLFSYPNDTQCGIAGGTLLLGGVDLNDDGILENNEVTVSADICNGAQGTQGASGSSPQYSPVIVINPCGPNSSTYKEALLGLSGGGVFGSFTESSNALTVRNTLLPDGSYYDTDDSECYFSVSTSSGNKRTVSWNGSTANGTGPFGPGYASYDPTTVAQWTEVYTSPGN